MTFYLIKNDQTSKVEWEREENKREEKRGKEEWGLNVEYPPQKTS